MTDEPGLKNKTANEQSAGAGDGRPPAIEVDGLRKSYRDIQAVDGVSFQVNSGTVVGILGPNGAGKTTIIKSVLGLVAPEEGTVRVDGIGVHSNPQSAYERLGAVLEGARNVYWRLTVWENLRFFSSLAGEDPDTLADRHEQLLEQLNLAAQADKRVDKLSRGMKQKVSLASTLAREPSIVVLDEPTLGLDVESTRELQQELRRLVAEESMTVLLSSHDMNVVEAVCDRVIIVDSGEIVANRPVDDLVGLFRTRAHRIVVDRAIPADTRQTLEQRFDVRGLGDTDEPDTFTVMPTRDDTLYAVIDVLHNTACRVIAVDTLDPDFEEIFLELTDRTDSSNRRNPNMGPDRQRHS
jgi:ABC-2 type transport system ATP-binding protein